MKYCITNKLAIECNWTGMGEKKAFGKSGLLSVVRSKLKLLKTRYDIIYSNAYYLCFEINLHQGTVFLMRFVHDTFI